MVLLMTLYASVICVCILKFIFTVMFCFIIAFLILHFLIIFWICIFFCYFPPQHLTHRGLGFTCVPAPPFSLVGPFILKSPVFSSRNLAFPLIILALSAQFWGKVFLSVKSCSWLLLVGSHYVSFLIPLFWIIFEKNYFILQRSSGYFLHRMYFLFYLLADRFKWLKLS